MWYLLPTAGCCLNLEKKERKNRTAVVETQQKLLYLLIYFKIHNKFCSSFYLQNRCVLWGCVTHGTKSVSALLLSFTVTERTANKDRDWAYWNKHTSFVKRKYEKELSLTFYELQKISFNLESDLKLYFYPKILLVTMVFNCNLLAEKPFAAANSSTCWHYSCSESNHLFKFILL